MKEEIFDDVILAILPGGLRVLISGPDRLVELMDGDLFDDNSNSLHLFPKERGAYKCSIRYTFEQGYFEGHEADGESDWDFIPFNIKRIELK